MARSSGSGAQSEAKKATWKSQPGKWGERNEGKKLGIEDDESWRVLPWNKPGLDRVGRVIAFLEWLPITAGILAGESMRLLAGQRQFIDDVYRERATPVRIGVKSEPRGNGKTGLVAGLALCHLLGPEAEERGQVFSASIDRGMASLIFEEMVAIVVTVPYLATRVAVQRVHKKIRVQRGPGAGSVYEALSADSRRAHGLRPSLWIYDELAQASDGNLLGNLRTAMGKTQRSLGLVISTQAPEDDHPLSQLIDDGLSGGDPSIVVHLTAAPIGADPFDPEVIRSVNPALGVFLDEGVVMAEAVQARRMPMWEPKFRNLRLNQRIEARGDERLCVASDWRRGHGAMALEDFEGRACYGGLDLSINRDLTAFVLAFPDDQAETGYDVVPFFWTPEEELAKRPPGEEERLRQWIDAGQIEVIPGATIAYHIVARKIADLAARVAIQTIAYDDWHMDAMKLELGALGVEVPLEKFGQGHSREMARSVGFFTECVQAGRLRHPGNPALTASVLNASIRMDRAGNPAIDKSKTRGVGRVDGAVALLMALGAARRFAGEPVEGRLAFA